MHASVKRDLVALGLCALALFLGASLLTYDAADPGNGLVFPTRAETLNVCGPLGAAASRWLFEAFGLAAYYVVGSLIAFDLVLLLRRPLTQPGLRVLGWAMSLVGLATLLAMTAPSWSPGPVIGPGGYFGAAGRGVMERHFAQVGAYILTSSLLLGGLLLASDYFVLKVLQWTVGRPSTQLGRGVIRVGAAYAQRIGRKRSDLDDLPAEFGGAPSVRISGRAAAPEADEDAEDVTDAAEDDEHDAEEPAVADDYDLASEDDATVAEPAVTPPKSASSKGKGSRRSLATMLGMAPASNADTEEMLEAIDEAVAAADADDYELPGVDMLLPSEPFSFDEQEKDVRRKAKVLEKTFADFGFNVRVVEIQTGPVIAQFEVELEAGLRLSKITSLSDDLAIALRVPSVRIVAPIPGKNTVGVEVPNTTRQLVRLREVMEEANGRAQKMRIPLYLGKDVAGAPMIVDLTSLPHLLIAGRTGTGKSVCLNSIIASMLMTRRPDEVRMLLIDPKMVELSPYKSIPHLMHPVVTDMKKAEAILGWAVEKMEERYHLLARAGVRHISNYNQLGEEELMERIQPESPEDRKQIPTNMPYIVIVADELADLMMTAAKEVEGHIIRLAQKSRAVGIHLVLATQKPTVDVITGLIKSNLPARICFQVASRTDSRVVLDEMGADKLLGNGDMLFLWPGTSMLLRGQGTYLSDDETNKIIAAVSTTEQQFVKELVTLKTADAAATNKDALAARDELYESAIDIVVREGRGSVSLLQRALGIGYGRAARLVDFMAEDGIVGAYNGSQAREVLLSVEDWEARGHGGGQNAAGAAGQGAGMRNAAGNNAGPLGTAAASRLTRSNDNGAGDADSSGATDAASPSRVSGGDDSVPRPTRTRNKITLSAPRPADYGDEDEGSAIGDEMGVSGSDDEVLAPWERGPSRGKRKSPAAVDAEVKQADTALADAEGSHVDGEGAADADEPDSYDEEAEYDEDAEVYEEDESDFEDEPVDEAHDALDDDEAQREERGEDEADGGERAGGMLAKHRRAAARSAERQHPSARRRA